MSHCNEHRSQSSRAVHLQEITPWELRERIEVKCDAIIGALNMMREDDLVRRRKRRQKVLWSLAGNGEREAK